MIINAKMGADEPILLIDILYPEIDDSPVSHKNKLNKACKKRQYYKVRRILRDNKLNIYDIGKSWKEYRYINDLVGGSGVWMTTDEFDITCWFLINFPDIYTGNDYINMLAYADLFLPKYSRIILDTILKYHGNFDIHINDNAILKMYYIQNSYKLCLWLLYNVPTFNNNNPPIINKIVPLSAILFKRTIPYDTISELCERKCRRNATDYIDVAEIPWVIRDNIAKLFIKMK